MSRLRLILASLCFHRRLHAAAALGVIAGHGRADRRAVGGRQRARQLAASGAGSLGCDRRSAGHRPLFSLGAGRRTSDVRAAGRWCRLSILRGTVNAPAGGTANGVGLYGIDDRFWQVLVRRAINSTTPKTGEVVAQPAAGRRACTCRWATKSSSACRRPAWCRAKACWAAKAKRSPAGGCSVSGVLPAGGAGSFSLNPSQQATFNAVSAPGRSARHSR